VTVVALTVASAACGPKAEKKAEPGVTESAAKRQLEGQPAPQIVESGVTEIPAKLQPMAKRTFDAGCKVFLWDADAPDPLELASYSPIGLRNVGYAFAPGSEPRPFVVASEIIRRDSGLRTSRISVVREGPTSPTAVGKAEIFIAVSTAEEVEKGFVGLKLAEGEGRATIFVVPEGTEANDSNKKRLSNEVTIQVVVR